MAESEDVAHAAARLEAALERIAQAIAARPPQPAGQPQAADTAEVSARLDNLIAQLRRALARHA